MIVHAQLERAARERQRPIEQDPPVAGVEVGLRGGRPERHGAVDQRRLDERAGGDEARCAGLRAPVA